MELKNKNLNINDVPGQKHLKLQDSNFIKNNEQYVILANMLTGIWQNDSKLNVSLPSACPGCTKPQLRSPVLNKPSTMALQTFKVILGYIVASLRPAWVM